MRHLPLRAIKLGDIGSTVPDATYGYANSSVRDGCDEFAILMDPSNDDSIGYGSTQRRTYATVDIYDGRTLRQMRDPANPNVLMSIPVLAEDCLADTNGSGFCGDGGRDLTGDGFPDLVVGAPGKATLNGSPFLSNHGGYPRGSITILDVRSYLVSGTLAPLVIDSPDPEDGWFGSSVAILGNVPTSGNPNTAEILVGSPGYYDLSGGSNPVPEYGRAYVITTDSLSPVMNFIRCPLAGVNSPVGANREFGRRVSMVGSVTTSSTGADDSYGNDQTAEFAISDPQYQPIAGSVPNGEIAWYNNLQGTGAPRLIFNPYVALQAKFGTAAWRNAFGNDLFAAGDIDGGKALGTTPSWDLIAGGGCEFRAFFIDPDDTNPPPFDNTISLIDPKAQFWDTTQSGRLDPNYFIGGQAYRTSHAPSMCAVGDIDLSGGVSGAPGSDDFAYVERPTGLSDIIHIVDSTNFMGIYSPTFTNPTWPADITAINSDPVTGRSFYGTAGGYDIGSGSPERWTTLSRIGDVDADGLDDFVVITGVSTTVAVTYPDTTLILIYGSSAAGGGAPPLPNPGQNPRIRGNKVAQRGSRIALVIDGCTPFAPITVCEDTTLSTPILECSGVRKVRGTYYSLTANAQGEAFFVRDLNYNSSNPADRTPGQSWYYQVKQLTSPCKLSNIWALNIINSSDPLDEFQGQ